MSPARPLLPPADAAGEGADPAGGSLADDPRVQAGVAHLQEAAREVIAASRALLDVAEELVDDPGSAQRLVGLVTSLTGPLAGLTDLAGRAARGAARPPRPGSGHDGDGDPPVQRIPVS